MNKLVKKLMLVAAMLMLAAGPSFAADAIRIGLMCPLTGKWASEGQDMQQIVSLLVSEVNKAGGINGKQIELIVEDDAGDPRTASLAAQKLASAGVMAVIGTYGSFPEHHRRSRNHADRHGVHQRAPDGKGPSPFLPHLPPR